ncbi:MAG TPA: membrane protein insertase YidC [Arachidicoccus sp.]
MKADKNTIIGFGLLIVLAVAYLVMNNRERKTYEASQKHLQDSLALVQKISAKPISIADSLHADSLGKANAAGGFVGAANGTEQTQVVENDLIKITFTNKGGQIEKVELKNYKSFDSSLVTLGGKENQLGFAINTSPTSSQYTNNLYFAPLPVVKNADGSQTVTYQITDANGELIQNQFIIAKADYLIDWNININGAQQLFTANMLNIQWNAVSHRQQYAVKYEKQQSYLCYSTPNDGYNYNSALKGASKDFNEGANWVAFKQQFFNQTLLSKNKFKSGSAIMANSSADADDTSRLIFGDTANFQMQIPATASVSIPMQLYYGPNDYQVLKQYDNGMKNMIDLGSGILAFAKYVNLWIIMPVFSFIASFVSNYGWVIILLTIFIRLVTSPLTYKSYYSSAKMKVLKPELDALKVKFPEQQAFAMEQMKLFREAGVNPLSGCLPLLLQIPIFLALYRFFNSSIALRGHGFLWANDLSAYDSIIHFSSHIPLLGDHLSLFTITYCVTSLFTSMYNMNMSTQSNAPGQEMMKYMPYIMPFVFFFVFNGLPSALTLYYTVSNLVTLCIQLVIQKYIIDHDKILAQINEKRKQPKQKSKLQVRMEQMQEQQKKIQDLRKKN